MLRVRVAGLCAGLVGAVWLVPAVWAMDEAAAVRFAMESAYGKADARSGTWRVVHEKVAYVLKPATVNKVNTRYGERVYVFASGKMANLNDAAHVSSGVVGAHVVEERDGRMTLIASTPALNAGAYGEAPEKATLRQFGPDHYYGWIMEDSYGGQGYTNNWNMILLPRGKRVAALARVLSGQDAEGAKPCADKETRNGCFQLTYELKIDTSNMAAKVWPLVVTKSGIEGGRTIKPVIYKLAFDEKAWKYVVPKTLSEGF